MFSACGSSSSSSPNSDSACDNTSEKTTLTVLAASSLVNVLKDQKDEMLAEIPCISNIEFSFGSSTAIAAQIANGAPADLFISASESAAESVRVALGLEALPQPFTYNRGEIMVSTKSKFLENVYNIADMRESENPGIQIGVCVSSAPCGKIADEIFENSKAVLEVSGLSRELIADTEASSVEELVTKIKLGELDAGIVYHSDCYVASKDESVRCIELANAANAHTEYVAVSLTKSFASGAVRSYLLAPAFQKVLNEKFGFYNYGYNLN
jgi:molybdate transport system substrate-binding protein